MALTPILLYTVILVVGGALEIKIHHSTAVLCNLTKEAHSPLCSSTPLVVIIKNNIIFRVNNIIIITIIIAVIIIIIITIVVVV